MRCPIITHSDFSEFLPTSQADADKLIQIPLSLSHEEVLLVLTVPMSQKLLSPTPPRPFLAMLYPNNKWQ